MRSIDEVLREGQPAARDLLHELPTIGFRLNGNALAPTRPPRTVGQDNIRWLAGA